MEIINFGGEIPRQSAFLLGDRFAQDAIDVDLRSGELRAFFGLLPVNTPTKAGTLNTIYRWAPEADSDAKGQITAVANTTPVAITSAAHGHSTGYRVYIDGTGLAIDGVTYDVTVTDVDNFTLDTSTASGTATTGTQVRENGYWFHWASSEATDGVEVSRLSLEDDTDDMVIYVGHEYPKITYNTIAVAGGTDYPVDQKRLGLPVPTVAPTVVVNGVGDGTTGGTGSAGAGKQYVEQTIEGVKYKMLHDGII